MLEYCLPTIDGGIVGPKVEAIIWAELRSIPSNLPIPHITKTSAANPYAYHPDNSFLLVKRVSSPSYWEGSSRKPAPDSGPILSWSAVLDRSSSASKEEEYDLVERFVLFEDSARGC